ncbi:MAG: transposase [Planctomycetaceae bacterium]
MPTPLYKNQDIRTAFHLRYTWTGWPTGGTNFPSQPDDAFFQELDIAWTTDNLKRFSMRWNDDEIQLAISTIPTVAPTLFVARVKGRLQHALRLAGTPVKFSRKVAFRALGDNHTSDVENYIAQQVDKEQFVDPRFAAMLKRFTVVDESVALNLPSESNSGRYWYNLHVVLIVADRARFRNEADFATLDRALVATATKHQYQLAVRAWMPDHLHVALRGNIAESPAEIALAFMNNTAFAMGQNAIWQHGFYAGTFSEYDVRALRVRE